MVSTPRASVSPINMATPPGEQAPDPVEPGEGEEVASQQSFISYMNKDDLRTMMELISKLQHEVRALKADLQKEKDNAKNHPKGLLGATRQAFVLRLARCAHAERMR